MVSFIHSFEENGIDVLSLPNMTLDVALAPWALLIVYILSCF